LCSFSETRLCTGLGLRGQAVDQVEVGEHTFCCALYIVVTMQIQGHRLSLNGGGGEGGEKRFYILVIELIIKYTFHLFPYSYLLTAFACMVWRSFSFSCISCVVHNILFLKSGLHFMLVQAECVRCPWAAGINVVASLNGVIFPSPLSSL
jgi:hypothetical protein